MYSDTEDEVAISQVTTTLKEILRHLDDHFEYRISVDMWEEDWGNGLHLPEQILPLCFKIFWQINWIAKGLLYMLTFLLYIKTYTIRNVLSLYLYSLTKCTDTVSKQNKYLFQFVKKKSIKAANPFLLVCLYQNNRWNSNQMVSSCYETKQY